MLVSGGMKYGFHAFSSHHFFEALRFSNIADNRYQKRIWKFRTKIQVEFKYLALGLIEGNQTGRV